jgi:hypothetical protein
VNPLPAIEQFSVRSRQYSALNSGSDQRTEDRERAF